MSVFPDELYQAPRSWTEKAYPNLVHYNELDRGGHFAAWEQPELYASELRDGLPVAALAMTLFERVHMPSFAGATEWLNSEPLGPAELRGHVVLVNFWTWTCINWLRQEPYVRAWSQAYRDDGLIVIGVHTPEFSFEHDIDGVRRATERASDRLPGRGRQRLRGLERLRQQLLAGAVLRRRRGHHQRSALRRRTLRGVGARDPAVARRRARARLRRRARRRGRGRLGSPVHARDLSRLSLAASSSRQPDQWLHARRACGSTNGHSPASGRSRPEHVVARRRRAGASPSGSMRATRTS